MTRVVACHAFRPEEACFTAQPRSVANTQILITVGPNLFGRFFLKPLHFLRGPWPKKFGHAAQQGQRTSKIQEI